MEECTCKGKGCAKCQVVFTLDSSSAGFVNSDKLKFKDSKIKPTSPKFPIAKLLKGQSLSITGVATLDYGLTHIKWSPALIWYTYNPTITINNKSPKLEEFRDQYPEKIFDKSGKIDQELLTSEPQLVDAVDGVCDDIIKVEYTNTDFLFHLESFGQLSEKEIMIKVTEVFEEQIDSFVDALKNASS